MNPAPAELLQLLTVAALQPTSTGSRSSVFTSLPLRVRKEKAALPEQLVRQAGLFFSLRFRAYCLVQRPIIRSILPDARDNITSSRFDKFNHVKYAHSLLARNRESQKKSRHLDGELHTLAPIGGMPNMRYRLYLSHFN